MLKRSNRKRKKNERMYWFQRFIGECPVCGRNMGYRVKRNGPRPLDVPRVILLNDFQTYDGCMERG